MHPPALCRLLALLLACSSACGSPPGGSSLGRDTLVLFAAASLAAPLGALLDSTMRREGTVVHVEHGGSLELARRVTELQRVPDAIVLADEEVFPELLVPRAASWYVRFARNRMVVAYTDRSRHAADLATAAWWEVLLRDDVIVGRPDPTVAPAGYRALLTYALAERHYGRPGLAARLADRTPARLVRGNAAELAGLLEAGELDYIVEYESLARARGFRFVRLPPEIDLGDAARAPRYAAAQVTVAWGRDSVMRRGAPIIFAATVPHGAPHPAVGARFVALLLGAEARAQLRRRHVDMLERPSLQGGPAPAVVQAAIARAPGTP